MLKIYSAFVLALFLGACQPKPTTLNMEPKPVKVDSEILIDSELDGNVDIGAGKIRLSTEQYFDMLNRIFELAREQALGGLTPKEKEQGLKLMSRVLKATNLFYQDSKLVTRVPVETSPYLRKALQTFEPDVKSGIEEGIKMLESHKKMITEEATALASLDQTGNLTINTTNVISEVRARLKLLQTALKRRKIDPRVEKELNLALQEQVEPMLKQVQDRLVQIKTQSTLSSAIEQVLLLVKEQEIELTPELSKTLSDAQSLGNKINEMTTGQHALTLIVIFWRQMSPEDREKTFKPVSEELYEKLLSSKPRRLECYAEEKDCQGIISSIEKKTIRARLKDYGLDKLKVAFNEGALEQLSNQLDIVAREQLASLPETIIEKAIPELDQQIVEIQEIAKNFRKIATNIFKEWAVTNKVTTPNGDMLGVEVEGIDLDLNKWTLARSPYAQLNRTTSETIGSAMSLQGQLWSSARMVSEGPVSIKRYMFHHLNRFLSILGYEQGNDQIQSGYLFPLVATVKPQPFHLENAFSFKPLYLFPPVLKFEGTLDPIVVKQTPYHLKSQISMLEGGTALLKVLKDYEKSHFDTLLGKVKLKDLKTDLVPEDQMNRQLFAKDNAFSLAVGVAASVLVNLAKAETPIFVIDSNGLTYWLKDIDLENFEGTIVKAGIANLDKNKTVKSSEVAGLIRALVGFLKATEDIEKTKASFLVDKDSSGERPLDVLLKARETLRSLTLGLSNYLSSELITRNGGAIKQVSVNSNGSDPLEYVLSDQYLAAEALIEAGSYLDIRIYEANAKQVLGWLLKNFENEIKDFNLIKQIKHLSVLNRWKKIETNPEVKAEINSAILTGLDAVEKRFIR